MEDIKKAIEEEYLEYLHGTTDEKEFLNNNDLLPFKDAVKACEITASFIFSKWEESTRWRKVEEELPERRDKPYYILVKDEVTDTIDVHIVYPETEFRYLRDYTHWKPIH